MEDKYLQMWLTRELSELAHLLGIEQKKVPVYVASLLYKTGHTKEKYDYSYYTSGLVIRNLITDTRKQLGETKCSACHRVAPRLKACGDCRESRYCNVMCQRADRARHRDYCRIVQDAEKAGMIVRGGSITFKYEADLNHDVLARILASPVFQQEP